MTLRPQDGNDAATSSRYNARAMGRNATVVKRDADLKCAPCRAMPRPALFPSVFALLSISGWLDKAPLPSAPPGLSR